MSSNSRKKRASLLIEEALAAKPATPRASEILAKLSPRAHGRVYVSSGLILPGPIAPIVPLTPSPGHPAHTLSRTQKGQP